MQPNRLAMEEPWDRVMIPPAYWERMRTETRSSHQVALSSSGCPQCRLQQRGPCKRLFSKIDCPCCLTTDCEPPNAFLSCGHTLCSSCLENLGGSFEAVEGAARSEEARRQLQANQLREVLMQPVSLLDMLRLTDELARWAEESVSQERARLTRFQAAHARLVATAGRQRHLMAIIGETAVGRTCDLLRKCVAFLTWFQVASTTHMGLSWLGLPLWVTLPMSLWLGLMIADFNECSCFGIGMIPLCTFFCCIFVLQMSTACYNDCQALVQGLARFPNSSTMSEVSASHAAVVKVLLVLGADSSAGLVFAARHGHVRMSEASYSQI